MFFCFFFFTWCLSQVESACAPASVACEEKTELTYGHVLVVCVACSREDRSGTLQSKRLFIIVLIICSAFSL